MSLVPYIGNLLAGCNRYSLPPAPNFPPIPDWKTEPDAFLIFLINCWLRRSSTRAHPAFSIPPFPVGNHLSLRLCSNTFSFYPVISDNSTWSYLIRTTFRYVPAHFDFVHLLRCIIYLKLRFPSSYFPNFTNPFDCVDSLQSDMFPGYTRHHFFPSQHRGLLAPLLADPNISSALASSPLSTFVFPPFNPSIPLSPSRTSPPSIVVDPVGVTNPAGALLSSPVVEDVSSPLPSTSPAPSLSFPHSPSNPSLSLVPFVPAPISPAVNVISPAAAAASSLAIAAPSSAAGVPVGPSSTPLPTSSSLPSVTAVVSSLPVAAPVSTVDLPSDLLSTSITNIPSDPLSTSAASFVPLSSSVDLSPTLPRPLEQKYPVRYVNFLHSSTLVRRTVIPTPTATAIHVRRGSLLPPSSAPFPFVDDDMVEYGDSSFPSSSPPSPSHYPSMDISPDSLSFHPIALAGISPSLILPSPPSGRLTRHNTPSTVPVAAATSLIAPPRKRSAPASSGSILPVASRPRSSLATRDVHYVSSLPSSRPPTPIPSSLPLSSSFSVSHPVASGLSDPAALASAVATAVASPSNLLHHIPYSLAALLSSSSSPLPSSAPLCPLLFLDPVRSPVSPFLCDACGFTSSSTTAPLPLAHWSCRIHSIDLCLDCGLSRLHSCDYRVLPRDTLGPADVDVHGRVILSPEIHDRYESGQHPPEVKGSTKSYSIVPLGIVRFVYAKSLAGSVAVLSNYYHDDLTDPARHGRLWGRCLTIDTFMIAPANFPSLSQLFLDDPYHLKSVTCSSCGPSQVSVYFCTDPTCHFSLCYHCYSLRRYGDFALVHLARGTFLPPLFPHQHPAFSHLPPPGHVDLSFSPFPCIFVDIIGLENPATIHSHSLDLLYGSCVFPGIGFYPFHFHTCSSSGKPDISPLLTHFDDIRADRLVIQVTAHRTSAGYEFVINKAKPYPSTIHLDSSSLLDHYVLPFVRRFRSIRPSSSILVVLNICDMNPVSWDDLYQHLPSSDQFELLGFALPVLVRDVSVNISSLIRCWVNRFTPRSLSACVPYALSPSLLDSSRPIVFSPGRAPLCFPLPPLPSLPPLVPKPSRPSLAAGLVVTSSPPIISTSSTLSSPSSLSPLSSSTPTAAAASASSLPASTLLPRRSWSSKDRNVAIISHLDQLHSSDPAALVTQGYSECTLDTLTSSLNALVSQLVPPSFTVATSLYVVAHGNSYAKFRRLHWGKSTLTSSHLCYLPTPVPASI